MKKTKPSIDPVIFVTLGVLFIAAAIVWLAVQAGADSTAGNSGLAGQLLLAFITGLTTGGLSCLAVQGGLLASSLAHQIEQDYAADLPKRKGVKKSAPVRVNSALPIALFLSAKLVAYTVLGAALGWLGSYFTFSPALRAILMIGIGVFMIGNGLRMFNLHPIFRYFAIEPPKLITRYIRKTAKGADPIAPLFLGALTVFIPCGVTQAMLATALGSANAMFGAALMFAFTLGTSPVFFIVAYLATELGAKLERFFMRFVAAVVLILGFVTMNSGLNLIGSPLALQSLTRSLFPSRSAVASAPAQPAPTNSGELILNVQNRGYSPQVLKAPANSALILKLITSQTYSCARDFVIPALNFYQLLPATGTVEVNLPPQTAGTQIPFTCSMGMYTGVILFE
ncbi:MAG: sulfite exporter TauE/SafE family protein [Anaerolineales bacterium]|nr:sulfite exporter TauE/SafE family protein [Anaerolineales bacterium]